ncbi:MAG TPA: hypothetical protein VGK52_09115 [Polyangia bacterium]
MALEWNGSPWMDCYRAALRRRRPRLWRRLAELADALREPFDTALVVGIILGAAILLACAFPV